MRGGDSALEEVQVVYTERESSIVDQSELQLRRTAGSGRPLSGRDGHTIARGVRFESPGLLRGLLRSRAGWHCALVLAVLPLCLGQICGAPASLVPDEQVAGFEPEPPPTTTDNSTTTSDDPIDVNPDDRTAAVIANAGADIDAQEESNVTLDGSASTGKSSLSYSWKQVSGRAVVLTSANQPICTFTAPAVVADPELFKFELTVTTRYNGRTYRARDVLWVSVHRKTGTGGGGGAAPPLSTPFSSSAPTLDGIVSASEWSDSAAYQMDGVDTVVPGVSVEGIPAGASDSSATIYLKHDQNYLYVAVAVVDNTVVPTAANSWEADTVEIYLDSDNSNSQLGFPGTPTGFHISANAGGGHAGSLIGTAWESAASIGGGGYAIEFRISKSVTGMNNGGTYGFDVAVLDYDAAPASLELCYFFFSSTRAVYDESSWGDIRLAEPTLTPGALAIAENAGLTSSGAAGGPFAPASMTYTLSNPGGSPIDWTATSTQPWITLSKSAGSLAAGANDAVTVSIGTAANSLGAGSYADVVTFTNITNSSGSATRAVSLTVNAPAPGVLAVSPADGLASSGIQGGPFSPGGITYTLTNTGGSPLNWAASKSQSWLSLLNTGGTLAPGASASVWVAIGSGATALPPGNHGDTITFTDATSGAAVTTRSVGLSISGTPGVLAVSPSGGLISWQNQGSSTRTPSSVTYTLSNTGGTSVNWTAAKTAAWVSLSKTSGTLAAGATDTVIVSYTTSANTLTPGTKTDTVTFSNAANGSGSTTRPVTLHVVPAMTIDASPSTGTAPLPVQLTAMAGSTAVTAGQLPTGSTLTWSYGDGTANGNGIQVNHTYSAAGSFLVALSLTLPSGLGTVSCDQRTLSVAGSTPAGPMTAPYTASAVTIDGTLGTNEWTDANSYPMDAADTTAPGVVVEGGSTGAADASAKVYVKQDATYLYVAVEVTDDNVVQTAADAWDADSVELFLDADNSDTAGIGLDRLQFDIAAGGAAVATAGVPAGSWISAAALRSGGYAVEYRLSKSALGLGAGTYGLDVHVHDMEPGAASLETGYWYYSAGPSPESDESQWGDIILPAASQSVLAVTPSGNLTSSGLQGGPFSPTLQLYTLTNTGTVSMNWTAAKTRTWVTLSKTGGTLAPGGTDLVIVSINSGANSLAGGNYSDTVTFTNTSHGVGNTTRSVSLTVTSSVGVLAVTPSGGLTGSGVQGGPFSPASQNYTLTNTGNASLSWTASKTQSWVTLSKTGGTLAAGGTDTVAVTFGTGANSLAVGSHSDTVTFTNTTNGNGNTTRSVSLTVNAAAGVLAVTPSTGLSSAGLQGGPFSASQVYTLTNTGTASLNWTASKTQSWVSLSKTSGTLAVGATDTVTASIGTGANTLAVGSYNDTVTFTNSTNGNGNTTRAVTLSVNSSSGQAMTTASRTSGVAPLAVFFDATSSSSGVVQPANANGIPHYASQTYVWNFGDDANARWNAGRKDANGQYPKRNEATGFTAAHVYENPGTYAVTLQVTPSGGQTLTYTQTITVTAPTATYYVSNSGSDSNTGTSPSAPFRTVSKAFSVGAGKRVLLNRGETFSGLPDPPNGTILGAYPDSGNKPVINAGDIWFGSNVTVMDIKFSANGLPTFNPNDYFLALRVDIVNAESAGGWYGDHQFMVDSTITDASLLSLFAHDSRLVLLGNTFNRATGSHNLYIDLVDRGVISCNNIWKPSTNGNGRHCLRIAGNPPDGPSRAVSVTDNDFDGSTTWRAVELAISSGEWDSTQHAENILFERNNVYAPGAQAIVELGDYRNTTVRNNTIQADEGFIIEGHVDISDGSGFDGPRGLWLHDNSVSVTGTWYSNSSPSSQQVYVYRNTVNGQLVGGNPPP